MKPAFSVIIPIYNAESTLGETLNSVSLQTYKDFEVICVNDGSTDGSVEILKNWKSENTAMDIHIINQPNAGLGGARNAGIARAKHPWVALLDADDIWTADKLERCAATLEQQSADVLFHDFTTFGSTHNRTRIGHPIQSFEDLLVKGNPIMPSAVVLKTDLLKEFPFSTDSSIHGAEDLDLWLRLLHSKKSFAHIDQSLTNYRQTGGMSTRLDDHLEKVKTVITKYYQQGWFDEGLYHNSISRKNWEAGRFYHKRKEHKKARQYYRACKNLSLKQQLILLLNSFHISL